MDVYFMKYGIRLQKLRKEKNLTQEELANILQIARVTYNHYEVQENIIPLIHLNSLANYFGVSIDYILSLTDTLYYPNSCMNIDDELFPKRLKEFRKENKLTLEKVASSINTNKSVICNYERGRNLIVTSFLYSICKEYNISADYLLGKTNEPKYFK